MNNMDPKDSTHAGQNSLEFIPLDFDPGLGQTVRFHVVSRIQGRFRPGVVMDFYRNGAKQGSAAATDGKGL